FCLRSHHVICQNVSTAPVKPGSAPIKNGALAVSERRVIVLAGFHAKTREGFLDPHYVAKGRRFGPHALQGAVPLRSQSQRDLDAHHSGRVFRTGVGSRPRSSTGPE